MFSVYKTENGYMLEINKEGAYATYVFEKLAKLRRAIKEILDMEKPQKEIK